MSIHNQVFIILMFFRERTYAHNVVKKSAINVPTTTYIIVLRYDDHIMEFLKTSLYAFVSKPRGCHRAPLNCISLSGSENEAKITYSNG